MPRQHALQDEQRGHTADHAEGQQQASTGNRRMQPVAEQQPGKAEEDLIHHRRHQQNAHPAEQLPITERRADSLAQSLLGWVLGVAFIYSALFGTGSFLYGRQSQALMWLVVFVISGGGLLRLVPRMWARAEG